MSLGQQRGIFPWYTFVSKDTDKTKEFFTKLFNWKTVEFEIPDYGKTTLFEHKGMQFADVTPVEKLNRPTENIPSHWVNYIAVDNVDETCDRATRYGAKVVEKPFDMPTIGRSALIQDPFGAYFMPFTPTDPTKIESAMKQEEGFICWNELMVADPKKAADFYGEVVGWSFKEQDMGPEFGTYYHFKANEKELDEHGLGGIMKTPPKAGNMPAAWMLYLKVNDIDAKTKEAESLGAKVLMTKTEIPNVGWFSLIEDPSGAHSYLFQHV